MQRDDRVAVPELAAGADDAVHLLLHLRVAPLHRVEVQLAGGVAGRPRGRRAAAHADPVGGAADLDDLHAHLRLVLLPVLGVHLAEATCEEDRLDPLPALAASRAEPEGAREAANEGLTKLVAVVAGPVGALDQDVGGLGHAWGVRPAAVLVRFLVHWQVQIANTVPNGPCHIGGANAASLDVSQAATRARLRTRKGADAGRHVVRLRRVDQVHVDLRVSIAARLAGLLRGVRVV
mmetsp:Transcript_106531/g.301278  ORF Transcript_106531/g.301278 Transcript_106531/m.301278 type:complete len:235 (-) Transcript_106531:931-1635(-)